MRSAFALRIISGKNIFICKSGKSADFPDLLFHEEGVVAVNGICSAAFCESAALRIAFSLFFMGKSATVDRQFSFTTPSVKMGYRNARRRSDIPKFKIIFPLKMAKAQRKPFQIVHSAKKRLLHARCSSLFLFADVRGCSYFWGASKAIAVAPAAASTLFREMGATS